MDIQETHEKIHEAGHHGGHNKGIAVMIAVLAALLAIVEMGGKSAQNTSLSANIEAANLWSFFQAKHMRETALTVAADSLELMTPPAANTAAVTKRIDTWRSTAQRYASDPESGEGRKELAVRAKDAEQRRDLALHAYHKFEYGAAMLEIGIVLASASVVTGMILLAVAAAGLGVLGTAFGVMGWLAPAVLEGLF